MDCSWRIHPEIVPVDTENQERNYPDARLKNSGSRNSDSDVPYHRWGRFIGFGIAGSIVGVMLNVSSAIHFSANSHLYKVKTALRRYVFP